MIRVPHSGKSAAVRVVWSGGVQGGSGVMIGGSDMSASFESNHIKIQHTAQMCPPQRGTKHAR